MKDLFISILNMSLTASYVAGLVFIARWGLKRLKLPTIFAYMLWAVVFIRLVLPISFESPLSLVPVKVNMIPGQITSELTPKIDSGINAADDSVNNAIAALPAPNPANSVNPMGIIMEALAAVWIVGMLAIVSYAIISYVRLQRKLSIATRVRDYIYESDQIKAPFVMGMLRPRIFLPLGLANEDFNYIVKHEQTHIRRYDYLIKPAAFLVLAVHWFNPIIWLSYYLMIKDMEMSCDESVMKRSEGDTRAAYSYTLLSLASKQGGFLGPLSFGESNVKERVRNIMNYKKPVFWIGCVMVAIVIIFSVGLLSNPLKALEPEGQYEQLWKYRTEYVGNSGKVSSISGHLDYPAPFKYDHIELQTKNKPYGLTVYIAMEEAVTEHQLPTAEQLAAAKPYFHKNALLLYGLIGNVDEIVFQLKGESEENSLFYTREWAQARVEKPVFSLTEKKEGFLAFLKTVDELALKDQVIQTVEGFGQNLKHVRIVTVPEEKTKELIDQYYTPYVAKELITAWKEHIESTPGRELSSPWPERIEVQSVIFTNDAVSEVQGHIIGMAGGEIVGKDAVSIHLKLEDGKWKIDHIEEK
ncbi:hypothetical protein PAT3040_02320 [Paenibacillus agaridevorans]|uniref:Peptidase M56 domain-containing protein n=1 Tax=Paenibacillus agaridevorans TaxID=171404 RepID=A0A2R5EQ15_9BACL|nr:M56 family metallopeptidase [Paenibacillus agaridevorans]GBG07759.1 hypothetical protein PAT3040_02320 [Paenibacillus agaridevorans]